MADREPLRHLDARDVRFREADPRLGIRTNLKGRRLLANYFEQF